MSKLWGSRFEKGTDALADSFTFSIGYDHKLARYDCMGSLAHAKMLGKCGIIPKKDASALVKGLTSILKQIEAGTFKFDPNAEDIHSHIQTVLKKAIGAPADKLHTARSRNDQVVLDVKLYCLDNLSHIAGQINQLQKAIVDFAEKNLDVIVPAYTHLQSAQVVLLAHHMLAYVEMLQRDKWRIVNCLERTDSMPLGSCALSGTTLPTDRMLVAKELGFREITDNSMDSVSDRDFIAEALSTIAITGMHLSRIAEDLIIWTTQEFDFLDIDWAFCTGSSIMPHKKNPDVLELIRGETGKLFSNSTEVLILLKGLPLTYNRDLQLDKPPLFESVEKMQMMLPLMAKLFGGLTVKKENVAKRITSEAFFTVDVMEYLIAKGVSYRHAHDIIGKIVKDCLDKGKKISELSLSELHTYAQEFDTDVKKLLHAANSVAAKKSFGSTNPALVKKQLADWKKLLK